MSSRAGKVQKQIAQQRLTTVCDVLTIMQNEADKMSWWQRKKIARQFVKKGNIDCFFQLAQENRKKEKKNAEVQNN